jgi:hypothetical protein
MGFLRLYNNLIYKESLSMQKIYFEIEYTLQKKWLLYLADTEYLVKHTLKIHKQPIKTHRAIKPIDTKVTRPILKEDKTW